MTDSHAVIAVTARSGWTGRYLHHDPSLTETGTLLRDLVNLRYTDRRHGLKHDQARQALVGDHPAGWAALGATTRTDPTRKARRAPAPIGRCLCHQDDGTPRPALIASALQALHHLEHDDSRDTPRPTHPQDPTDGSPWLIRSDSHQTLPEGIDRAYLVSFHDLRILVRDGIRHHPTPRSFIEAGAVPWKSEADWDGIEAAAERIRHRTPADRNAEEDALILAKAAQRLAAIPEYDELVLHTLREAGQYMPRHAPQAALADTAGVRPAELPGHLLGLSRTAQVALLQAAAHRLDPLHHRRPNRTV
jgi:hypothetical protein